LGKLVLYLIDGSTREVYLTRERTTIGRRPDNDLSLPFAAVSGEHAAVITVLSDSFLEDLGSTNGTLVNGKSVTKHYLRDRDHIDIGRQNLVYYVEDDALPDPLPAELLQGAGPGAATLAPGRDALASRASSGSARSVATDLDANEADERTSPFRSVISDPDASGLSGTDAPGTARSVDTENDDASDLAIRVVSGPNAGREVALDKDRIMVGSVGVCVALVMRVGDSVRLSAAEGPELPTLKGERVYAEGVALAPGDAFDVAGAELTLVRR
jgi:predicted component of type VI protein secretion system